jgi:hypothetical protein
MRDVTGLRVKRRYISLSKSELDDIFKIFARLREEAGDFHSADEADDRSAVQRSPEEIGRLSWWQHATCSPCTSTSKAWSGRPSF